MSPGVDSDLKLEIAHVLTIDVVAYSTLLIHEQSNLMAELTKIVRNTSRFRIAENEGKLTRLPTGDGMALVFFGDPEGPIECAIQISGELTHCPEIQLRMGIHSGPINQILDVNDRSNFAGAGIDVAQRVMDCGDAGHILLSKRVADDLAPYPRWNCHLHELGECDVKHGRKISLFNFYTDSIGNSKLPQKLERAIALRRSSSRRRKYYFVFPLIGALAMATAFLLWPHKPLNRSIAVLPFLDLSQAKDQEYFGDGICEQIINSLGKIRGLRVLARSSSFSFKGKNEDARVVGKKLGVTHIVDGSINRSAGHVRVNADLIEVETGYQLWAENYDFTEQDALSLQSDIAQQVAHTLEFELKFVDARQIKTPPTSDPEAYDLYLQGRYSLNKRTAVSLQRARELFEHAVALDRRFALGYTGLADAYILLGEYGILSVEEATNHARPAISGALQIDDQLAEAHISRALLLTDFEWNWSEAEKDYRKGIELNPNNATAHHWFALHQAELGRTDEALHQIGVAQQLDPLSPIIRAARAKILLMGHRFEQAVLQAHKVFELEPNFAPGYSVLAQAYVFQGKNAEAIDAVRRYVDLSGGGDQEQLELAFVYAFGQRNAEAEHVMRDVQSRAGNFSLYDMAAIHAALADPVAALQWLKQSIDQHSVDAVWLRVDPRLDTIRSDEGFKEIRANLKPRE